MTKLSLYRSRATALLLLFVFLTITACGGQQAPEDNGSQQKADTQQQASSGQSTGAGSTKATTNGQASSGSTTSKASSGQSASGGGETVEALKPEDVLSEKERTGAPEFSKWNDPAGDVEAIPITADSSVGAIPSVKPFNFGRDPGGPEDKTLYLSVPKLGISGIPVFDDVNEENLKESVVRVPATGYPWQEESNTYIAGHRIGYEDTGSWHVFYDLDLLGEGDEVFLEDAEGKEYTYRITKQVVVTPENIEVMEPQPGKSVISLQTCTLPDYKERIIVQGDLIEENS